MTKQMVRKSIESLFSGDAIENWEASFSRGIVSEITVANDTSDDLDSDPFPPMHLTIATRKRSNAMLVSELSDPDNFVALRNLLAM